VTALYGVCAKAMREPATGDPSFVVIRTINSPKSPAKATDEKTALKNAARRKCNNDMDFPSDKVKNRMRFDKSMVRLN